MGQPPPDLARLSCALDDLLPGAVVVSADHEVVDRRRIELVEPGMTAARIHYEAWRLDVATTAALVSKVRASVVRPTLAALDEIANALPEPVVSKGRCATGGMPPDT